MFTVYLQILEAWVNMFILSTIVGWCSIPKLGPILTPNRYCKVLQVPITRILEYINKISMAMSCSKSKHLIKDLTSSNTFSWFNFESLYLIYSGYLHHLIALAQASSILLPNNILALENFRQFCQFARISKYLTLSSTTSSRVNKTRSMVMSINSTKSFLVLNVEISFIKR